MYGSGELPNKNRYRDGRRLQNGTPRNNVGGKGETRDELLIVNWKILLKITSSIMQVVLSLDRVSPRPSVTLGLIFQVRFRSQ